MADIVIFDMDGTLMNTAMGTVTAVQECAEHYDLPSLSHNVIRCAIGWANPEFYHRLYPNLSWELLLRFGNDVEKREGELLLGLGKEILFPGIEDLLYTLLREGKKLYLASTGDPEHVSICMRATDLTPCFTRIYCGEPDKANMLARIIARHPATEIVMVGDTIKDVQAARANGLRVIGAGFGYCDPTRAPLFDAVASTPSELLQMVR